MVWWLKKSRIYSICTSRLSHQELYDATRLCFTTTTGLPDPDCSCGFWSENWSSHCIVSCDDVKETIIRLNNEWVGWAFNSLCINICSSIISRTSSHKLLLGWKFGARVYWLCIFFSTVPWTKVTVQCTCSSIVRGWKQFGRVTEQMFSLSGLWRGNSQAVHPNVIDCQTD